MSPKKRKAEHNEDQPGTKKAKLVSAQKEESNSVTTSGCEVTQQTIDSTAELEDENDGSEERILNFHHLLAPHEKFFLRTSQYHENVVTRAWLNASTLLRLSITPKVNTDSNCQMRESIFPGDIWRLILSEMTVVEVAKISTTSKWFKQYYDTLPMDKWQKYFTSRGWNLPHEVFNRTLKAEGFTHRGIVISNDKVDWIGEVKRNSVTEKRIKDLVEAITDKIRGIVGDETLAVFEEGLTEKDILRSSIAAQTGLSNDIRAYLKVCRGPQSWWFSDRRYCEIGLPLWDDFGAISSARDFEWFAADYYRQLRYEISKYMLVLQSSESDLPDNVNYAKMAMNVWELEREDGDPYDDTSPALVYDPIGGCFLLWDEHCEPIVFGTLLDLLQFFCDMLDHNWAPLYINFKNIDSEIFLERFTNEQMRKLPADPFETVVLEVLEDLNDNGLNITPRAQMIAANVAKQFLVDVFTKSQTMENNATLQPATFVKAANEMQSTNMFERQTTDENAMAEDSTNNIED